MTLIRLIAAPFVLVIILNRFIFHALRMTYLFIRYGGEWITYAKTDKVTIKDIFEQLKENK